MRILSGSFAAALIGMAAVPALAQGYTFDFVNNSALAIHEIYMKASSDSDWGDNMIAGDPLVNGEVGTADVWDGICVYDFAYVMETGKVNYEYQVDLCEVGTLTVHDE